MKEHLCWHLSYLFTFELRIPYYPWSSTKIDQDFCFGIIHWQCKSVAFKTCFIGKRFRKCLSKRQAGIFNCMMFVYMKIAFAFNRKIQLTMSRNLI
ncbi:hypothetical protein A343_0014, partial [Porphyromonas gingivalis JCVI SC001]